MAAKQRPADVVFEPPDMPADRRLGQVQLSRGLGKAKGAGRGLKAAQIIQRRKILHVGKPQQDRPHLDGMT